MEKNYEYHEDLDILYIYNNPYREKPVGNLVFGNIIVDVAENGKVLGIEIDSASKFFNIPIEQLCSIRDISIKIIRVGEMLSLGIFLSTPTRDHSFQFTIPQEYSDKAIISY